MSGIEGILDEEGESIISYDTFNNLLKELFPNLRKASDKHKITCVCEICITAHNMQDALNKLRENQNEILKIEIKIDILDSKLIP